MNLRQLRALRRSSMWRRRLAALRLHLSQPALSRQIHALES
jgi:DNA-binding transcriptional LysR family regulator